MASDAASLQALVDPTCERPWWSGQNFTFGCKFGPEPILIFVVISGFAAEHDGHIVLLPRIICHAFYRREFKGVVFFTMTVVVRPATKFLIPRSPGFRRAVGAQHMGRPERRFHRPTSGLPTPAKRPRQMRRSLRRQKADPEPLRPSQTQQTQQSPPQKRRRQLSIFSFLHSPFFVFTGGIVG